ncbi:MAG: hypothetical protein C7B46_07710 [Sulfobacillus benefaciens]|uniref:Uncharacterized protein n=1 Tax=Sulfobacillus benefaciens TaxID=453960 RepID=A0A2T2XHM9_9FIRM|nr:MAG: hypothetical protein C7B46_07710 [Sulfobacillus benefaciens]
MTNLQRARATQSNGIQTVLEGRSVISDVLGGTIFSRLTECAYAWGRLQHVAFLDGQTVALSITTPNPIAPPGYLLAPTQCARSVERQLNLGLPAADTPLHSPSVHRLRAVLKVLTFVCESFQDNTIELD